MSMSSWFKSLFSKREVSEGKVVAFPSKKVDESPSLMEDDPEPEATTFVGEGKVSEPVVEAAVAKDDPSKPNRDLEKLHPILRKKLEPALKECHDKGLMIYVFEGYRSFERQDWLYAQGRTTPGKIVTRAKPGKSWHNYGLAVDLVFDGSDKDGIQWSWSGSYKNPKLTNQERDHWTQVGEIMEKYGFEWAARWKSFPETPHFQFTAGLKLASAERTYQEHGLLAVWDAIFHQV